MADPVFFDIDAVIFSRVLKTTQVREGPHGHGANRRKALRADRPPSNLPARSASCAREAESTRSKTGDATRAGAPGLPFGLRQADPGSMLDRMELAAEQCDVAVIGGGPAGSTAAALLAQRGLNVIALEKARHPRFTSANRCCR